MPDANLGIVMSASRTRRQMIQRMGRILRRKRPGVAARFVIMFAKDTLEDPANRIERDGFLDEIERISEATGVFDGARLRGARRVPRRARPRRSFPSPSTSSATSAPRPPPARHARRSRSTTRRSSRSPTRSGVEVGVRVPDASRGRRSGRRRRRPRSIRGSDARLPRAERHARRTSSSSSPTLPAVAKPRVEPKRLSTGQAPLEIARIGSRVADQLHRLRRSLTARAVPLAGPRPDRAPAAATERRPFPPQRATLVAGSLNARSAAGRVTCFPWKVSTVAPFTTRAWAASQSDRRPGRRARSRHRGRCRHRHRR